MAAHRMQLYPNLVRKQRTYRHKECDLDIHDDHGLRQRYRFGRASINYITDLIKDKLDRPTQRNKSIPAVRQVMLALRFYASGSFVQLVADLQGYDKGTASRIIVDVTEALASLKDEFIKWPSKEEEWRQIHAGFYEMAAFPNVIGCVDGTQIRIQAPATPDWYHQNDQNRPTYESSFVCRKQYHSINTQGICDHKGNNFTSVLMIYLTVIPTTGSCTLACTRPRPILCGGYTNSHNTTFYIQG